ncbi:hypothetical protein CE91St41_31250 [Oscillospiraceae bacterium]|nr:hypothetical protein CE91St40_31250 [Oscillospiraceae bacterium]BDF76236.1 hypothetical protein CE91St41_31250 [Oscillospiraceae bacterium]
MGYNEDNQKREGPALLGCARPVDLLNALLSFAYTLLVHNCAAALESLGLDPDEGFLHRDRPGVTSGWWLRTGSWQSFPMRSHHKSGYSAPSSRAIYSRADLHGRKTRYSLFNLYKAEMDLCVNLLSPAAGGRGLKCGLRGGVPPGGGVARRRRAGVEIPVSASLR